MRGLRGVGIQGLVNPVFSVGCPGGALGLAGTILSYNPIAYWPLNELAGVTAINYGSLGTAANGTYNGVTLDQIDAPGGGRAGLWDGVNDYGYLASGALTALNTAINMDECTVLIFGYDLSLISVLWLIDLFTDADNYSNIVRSGTNNVQPYREAQNIDTGYTNVTTVSGWNLVGFTASISAGKFKRYANGVEHATVTNIATSHVGAIASCRVGISNSGSGRWYGYLAHAAIYNSVLTQPQIANIYAAGCV